MTVTSTITSICSCTSRPIVVYLMSIVDSSFGFSTLAAGAGVVAGGEIGVDGAAFAGADSCMNWPPASGPTVWDASALDACDWSGNTGFLAMDG